MLRQGDQAVSVYDGRILIFVAHHPVRGVIIAARDEGVVRRRAAEAGVCDDVIFRWVPRLRRECISITVEGGVKSFTYVESGQRRQ